MRRGEVLGLRWQDVDLDAGTLKVTTNLQQIDGKLVLARPKTKEGQRTLPLPSPLVTAMHNHKARQLQDRLVAGSRWKENGLVFCTSIGTPISPRNLLRSLQTLLDHAGLPHMRFHDLRHSRASFLAAQGVSPKVAQQVLGHSDIRTTLAIYTHVSDDGKRKAMQIIGRLFDGG